MAISLTSTDEGFHCTGISDAAACVTAILEDAGIHIVKSVPSNRGLHRDIVEAETGLVHHVKFAKEPFWAFGSFFHQYKGQQGETLNVEVLDKLPQNSTLWFALPDALYNVKKGDFESENLIRLLGKGEYKTIAFSYPLEKMGRVL